MRELSNQDRLAAALAEEADDDLPPEDPGIPIVKAFEEWWPDLNPTQMAIFNDDSIVVAAVGEKGTGKTIGCLHRLVRHCYENFNALAWIIAPTQSSGYEGAGHDLVNLVLPAWRDGNRHALFINDKGKLTPNPKAGELMDHGIGLKYTEWKLDPVTKDRILWIQNRYGGWSKVMLKSILFPGQVDARCRGPAPSFVYLEEATVCEGKEYLTFPRAQLGRRRYITGSQQYLFSCNPAGPSNWVHKELYVDCVRPDGRAWPKDKEKPGIKRDQMYAVYDVPYEENIHRLPAGYRENLESTFRSDPILWARLIEGKWLEFPSGIALFKLHYSEAKHVRGNANTNRGLRPIIKHPIVLSYDPGKVNQGIQFLQCFETEMGPFWINFDQVMTYSEKVHVRVIVKAVVEKMAYWNRVMKYPFQYRHFSDNSAFNQFNASTGSTDVADFLRWSKKYIAENPQRYEGLEPIRMLEVPKPPGSVEERVSILMDLLKDEQFMASDTCQWTKSMFLHLERSDESVMEPKKPSKYSHAFDSLTYAMFYRNHVLKNGFRENNGSAVKVS